MKSGRNMRAQQQRMRYSHIVSYSQARCSLHSWISPHPTQHPTSLTPPPQAEGNEPQGQWRKRKRKKSFSDPPVERFALQQKKKMCRKFFSLKSSPSRLLPSPHIPLISLAWDDGVWGRTPSTGWSVSLRESRLRCGLQGWSHFRHPDTEILKG